MEFEVVAHTFREMEGTSSRLALTDYLVSLFRETPSTLIGKVTYMIQGKIAPDYEGIELGIADKMVVRAISICSGHEISHIQSLVRKTGDLGEAAEEAMKSKSQVTLFSQPMTVERVYDTLSLIAKTSGSGSQELKLRHMSSLLNEATPLQARYVVKFVLGQLRLGIADYTILDALAVAFTGDKKNREALEEAYNVSSDLGTVAEIVCKEGLKGLTAVKPMVLRPIRPMLAERVSSAEDALDRIAGEAAVEYKLDGERVQVHKKGKRVELFSRSLERITSHYPDIVKAAAEIRTADAIVEGEVVAVNAETGEYLPFQDLMHRRRKHGVEEAMASYPVVLNLFDVLFAEGESKMGLPYQKRRRLLSSLVRGGLNSIKLIEQITARSTRSIDAFMAAAISHGCEGVMIKQPASTYRAGAREFAWMKLKREYRGELVDSLDLVVVGALFGKGRRVGRYGALLVAVFDKEMDLFRSVCKVGTGFTDEHLSNLYSRLENHILDHRHPRVDSRMEMNVWFEPALVIEVIASEITLSPSHTAAMDRIRKDFGLALRFPKFTGKVRDDKSPQDATTVEELLEMYAKQLKSSAPKKT